MSETTVQTQGNPDLLYGLHDRPDRVAMRDDEHVTNTLQLKLGLGWIG